MKRVVIVTGATSGIGKAIAEKFIDDNDTVIFIGRNKNKLKEIKNKYGNMCKTFSVDVSQEKQVTDSFTNIKKEFDNIDILINAAGFFKLVNTNIPTLEAISNWNSVISTSLTSAFLMSLNTAKLIKKPGGRIINISSIGAFTGGNSSGGMVYSASKAGLNGLTFGLARELSEYGVTVNSIAPGFIENTGFTSVYTKEQIEKITKIIPANRTGKVEDIAETCFFLCSEKASYITGEIINVNGGWLFGR